MDFISIKEVAHKFKKSEADLIKKCEHGEIKNCCLIKGQWFIPKTINNNNENHINSIDNSKPMTLKEISKELSISIATVQNWIKLGKLKPNLVTNNKLGFSHQYINEIKSNLQSGKNNALKSRRNKKFASGNFLYKDYVSENCINIQTIQQLFNLASTKHVEFDDNAIQYLVAECAISIFVEKLQIPITHNANYLEQFLSNKIDLKKYNQLILDLIIDKIHASEYCKHNTELFSFTYSFECREDILGLMYLSCKNICNRKASGSYYTPTNIVQKLISKLPLKENSSILDPCCGTGNFLLQLTKYQNFKNIYGNDIDPISVKITRLNMALHYPEQDIDTIYAHITQKDYLLDSSTKEFDFIVGNPPWGCEFTENTKKELKQLYLCLNAFKDQGRFRAILFDGGNHKRIMEISFPRSHLNQFSIFDFGVLEVDDLDLFAKKLKRFEKYLIPGLEVAFIKVVIEIDCHVDPGGMELIDKPFQHSWTIHHVAPSPFDGDVRPHFFGITSQFRKNRFAFLIAFFGLVFRIVGPRRIVERTCFRSNIGMAKSLGNPKIRFKIINPFLNDLRIGMDRIEIGAQHRHLNRVFF